MIKAEEHSAFLAEFAAELGYFFELASADIDRTSEFIEWFSAKVFKHGYNHGVEDCMNGVSEPKKVPTIDEAAMRILRKPGGRLP